jgi:hypothetical protein
MGGAVHQAARAATRAASPPASSAAGGAVRPRARPALARGTASSKWSSRNARSWSWNYCAPRGGMPGQPISAAARKTQRADVARA